MEQRDSRREVATRILRGYGKFLKQQEADINEVLKKSDIFTHENVKTFTPIGLAVEPRENISVLDVIESDNRMLNKIIAVFTVLCEEIKALQQEAEDKHFIFLVFYGESCKKSDVLPEEYIGSHIKNLHMLTVFVKRCYEVISNFCNQLVALYGSNLLNLKVMKLDYLVSQLGNLLVTLITIDTLVNCSPLQSHWSMYRKAVRSMNFHSEEYSKTMRNSKSLEVVLNNIEDKILCDKAFQNCIDTLTNVKIMLNKSSFPVADDFLLCLKKKISDLEKTPADLCESSQSIEWVKLNALFVFHFHVFGSADKKLLRNLFDVNLKVHTVPLFGTAVWHPEEFLQRHANILCNTSKMTQSLMKARQLYVLNKKQSLLKEVYNAQVQSCRWTFELIETFSTGESQIDVMNMNHRMELLTQGVKFVSQINYLVTTFMSIHFSQRAPITKSSLMSICKLIEILKGMMSVFMNHFAAIVSSINLIVQHLLYQIISQLTLIKKKLMADKNYSNRLDELTAVVIAERSLRGPPTFQRRAVANVALSIVSLALFSDETILKITTLLDKLEYISNIHIQIKSLCNCLFMYWHKTVIPVYLQNIYNTKKDVTRMKYVINALNDCAESIKIYENCFSSSDNFDSFRKEIKGYLNEDVLKPLSQQIETNLRLHVHSHLQLDSMNPFTVPVENNYALLSMKQMKFYNTYLSINCAVEHYLSYMFYNLTTVVLHDWRTYGEMRQLVKFKFNLTTIEDHLPTQTLEQGLDVLEIMRNIHIFVSKYNYNLNNQVFIEQNSNSKYLNTINIRHVANSIRTHGIGIMNTTVNFTYQFLRKKFHTFSQFMYDEQIKSRLIKDMRHFRDVTSMSEQMYSYKKAEKFNKGIRNLGLNENGQSYLDLFRLLISHIGNAMGYVRMIRSGGLHCCANATTFLPSLDEDSYGVISVKDDADELVKEAVDNLSSNIRNLTSNFSQGTDYFKLLVNVFTPVFRNPDNMHLKSFYMIVPPLTVNFIENMLLSKDKMSKKNKTGAGFTDDGFAMGLAYILKLLDQDEGMDSLHWFESVNMHIAEERKSIAIQLAKGSDHIQHALALTEKKITVLEQEFQLLHFSFSSARIFFQ